MTIAQKQRLLSSGQLISIAEAAKGTPYSAEYLSLLARKGRLVAVKLSRDWLTTREVVIEYIREQEKKHFRKLQELRQVQGEVSYE